MIIPISGIDENRSGKHGKIKSLPTSGFGSLQIRKNRYVGCADHLSRIPSHNYLPSGTPRQTFSSSYANQRVRLGIGIQKYLSYRSVCKLALARLIEKGGKCIKYFDASIYPLCEVEEGVPSISCNKIVL